MIKIYLLALAPLTLLMGCQSLGDHFNCMAQVDRTVPAQTQQRYVRTDTKCSTSGGAIATPTTTRGDQYIVNNNSQTNCTSTPIYETIVLNQSQRDAAYQQCRNGISSQRSSASSYSSGGGTYSLQEAQSMCAQYGNKPNTNGMNTCVNNIVGVGK